jgi:flagellar FliL protein
MSATARPAEEVDAPAPPKRGSKKLLTLIVAALLVLAAGGGAAVFVAKKRAAAAAEAEADGDGVPAAKSTGPHEWRKTPPAFLPMDVFVVNLADHDTERFAQIGITLELDDAKSAEEIKAYMPAIRNGILLVLAHKTSQQLLDRVGKEKLAVEILRESVRPLGIELNDAALARSTTEDGTASGAPVSAPEGTPVRRVHFSSFIIQ